MEGNTYKQSQIKPAPWMFKGSGIILTTQFDAATLADNPLTALWLKKRCLGGRGYYLALNFESSAIGPYSELMVLPGKFKAPQGKRHAIAQSYCDSDDAIANYSANWGIETERAHIAYGQRAENEIAFSTQLEQETIFSTQIRTFGPSIPFATGSNLIKLISEQGKKRYYLGFSIKGKARLASLQDFTLDSNKVLAPAEGIRTRAFYLEEFTLELPIPIKETTIEHFKFRLAQQTASTTSSASPCDTQ